MSREKHEKSLSSYELIKTNLLLGGGKMVAILPTQPIHVVMRRQQAALVFKNNPRVLSAREAYREIRLGQPVTALFKGATPAIFQSGFKNLIYKGALIKAAPVWADTLVPGFIQQHTSTNQLHIIKAFTAAWIAALSDAILSGPFESWATYLSTSQGEYANASFWGDLREERGVSCKIYGAYRGFIPATLKSTVAFTTFFASAGYVQTMTNAMYGLSSNDKIPWYAMVTSSLMSGLGVALTSSPFDIIKTHCQMPGAPGDRVLRGLLNIFKTHGIVGVTAGLPAKVLMITIGWGLTFFATQVAAEKNANTAESPEFPACSK